MTFFSVLSGRGSGVPLRPGTGGGKRLKSRGGGGKTRVQSRMDNGRKRKRGKPGRRVGQIEVRAARAKGEWEGRGAGREQNGRERKPPVKKAQNAKKQPPYWVTAFVCWRLPIVPGRFQPSIVGTSELNFRVRDGNGWTLTVINTNFEAFSLRLLLPQSPGKLSLFCLSAGDPCGIRTHVNGVRGRCLNRLTNGP